ncbi:hypothetical protein C8J57DRAFT_1654808 [Mycena rebaudengoi]|nr:hypothetical protein C8J57DRAFT_1654808 [Mycena rebaudengoi]
MTQTITVPLAPSIPHHLAPEILDKSSNNWPTWERSIVSCLTLVGLQGYLTGSVLYPADPAGAANWRTNDQARRRAALHFRAHERQAVWDSLASRHVDVGTQIRLIREAFSVRYGQHESPTATSTRIEALATLIFQLGPVNKDVFISAVTFNAVQGDMQSVVGERNPPSDTPSYTSTPRLTERDAISAIANELLYVQRELSPAVAAFLPIAAQEPNERGLTRLLELSFQSLGRTGCNQSRTRLGEGQYSSDAAVIEEAAHCPSIAITAELSKVVGELAPSVSAFVHSTEPSERERARLSELIFQSLERLDAITLEPEWEDARKGRRSVVEEVQKLQSFLDGVSTSSNPPAAAPPGPDRQHIAIDAITAELSKVVGELQPSVSAFVHSTEPSERERARLSELISQSLERLDAITLEPEWEEARKGRRRVVEELQKLQSFLDRVPISGHPPAAAHDAQHTAMAAITTELSKMQGELAPSVSAFLHATEAPERDRARLLELISHSLERLDAVSLEPEWQEARKERRHAIQELQRLESMLETSHQDPASSDSGGEPPSSDDGEKNALSAVASELLKYSTNSYLRDEKERGRLSGLTLQSLERLDGINMEPQWEEARKARRSAVKEVQELQNKLEAPPASQSGTSHDAGTRIPSEKAAVSAISSHLWKIEHELSPVILTFLRTSLFGRAAGQEPNQREWRRLSELSLQFLEQLDGVIIEPEWEEARRERRRAVKEVQKLQSMLDVWGPEGILSL